MSTQVQEDITPAAWVDITTSLTLVDDQRYMIQNISTYNVWIAESATVPALTDVGHSLDVGSCPWLIEQDLGKVFWVRSDIYSAVVVVTEA